MPRDRSSSRSTATVLRSRTTPIERRSNPDENDAGLTKMNAYGSDPTNLHGAVAVGLGGSAGIGQGSVFHSSNRREHVSDTRLPDFLALFSQCNADDEPLRPAIRFAGFDHSDGTVHLTI